jgi:hypothetical protein
LRRAIISQHEFVLVKKVKQHAYFSRVAAFSDLIAQEVVSPDQAQCFGIEDHVSQEPRNDSVGVRGRKSIPQSRGEVVAQVLFADLKKKIITC